MQTSSHQGITPPHNQIAQIAQNLWQQAGQPENRDLEFWLKAEQRIQTKQGLNATDAEQRQKASSVDVLSAPAAKPARRDRKPA